MTTATCNNGTEVKMMHMQSSDASQVPSGDIGSIIGKLSGEDIEYCIRKDQVVIGRNSSNRKVDVDVGLSSYVSRKHLQINYEQGRFILVCLGKNGVFVDGQFQRLRSSPLPLDRACVIRFPSTSICLTFEPHPQENDSDTSDKKLANEAESIPPSAAENEPPTHNSIASSSLSKNKPLSSVPHLEIGARTFASPSFTHMAHGFLSAPPSPTGTISAMNSCPSSPKRTTFFMSQNQRVTEDLHAAASAIAATVVDKQNNNDISHEGVDSKPPYSYAQLIIQAISSAPLKQLTLSGIYAHITKNYPYYKTVDKGWQNSIRHNLSLNRYFVKVPRSQEESGKGSFWKIDPHSERKLVEQAWRKRRQRATPCISTTLPLSGSAVIRSAPVSPERSNPISPLSRSQGATSSLQETAHRSLHRGGADAGTRMVKLDARYAQSAPGSPTGHGRLFVMATAPDATGDSPSVAAVAHHRAAAMTSVGVFSLDDKEANKVMWPLQPINTQISQSLPPRTTSTSQEDTAGRSSDSTTSATHPTTTVPATSLVSVVMPTSSAAATNIVTLSAQQHQQLLQQPQQKFQQQLVMVTGQTPQGVHHAIPLNIGTIVAAPGPLMNHSVPFVVPAPVSQQYLTKRANGNSSASVGVVQAKKAKAEDNVSNESQSTKPSG